MEEFKLMLFKEEYGFQFPEYEHLSQDSCNELVCKLIENFDLKGSDGVTSILNLEKHSLIELDAKESFFLIKLLSDLSITPQPKIYINWYLFNDIDIFKLTDLDKYFSDIWFPGSDDIELFDNSLGWILAIRHDGSVSYVKKK